MAVNMLGTAQVSALGSSEASALQRFKCISIMGGGTSKMKSGVGKIVVGGMPSPTF